MNENPNPPDLSDPELIEPAIFWYWNDTPTHRQIDRQLDDFLARSFRAIYIHPMPQSFRPHDFHGGMGVEYLSDAFFDLVAYTCDGVRRRNMILWLYDEGGWPSGVAGGKVVAEDPSFGLWVLDWENGRAIPRQLLDQIGYPDLMNPAATDCFIRHTHEKYRERLGAEFGRTVRGIFTDEPRLIGRLGTDRIPWSPLLPKHFLQADVVHRLFDGAAEDDGTKRIRRDYLRHVSILVAENYYGRIRRWCEKNHLIFEGHHSGEDEFSRHSQNFGDYLQQARQYHIPGVDAIWRQVFPGRGGGNYVGLASSVSWLRNQRIAVCENFAVYGAGLTLEQMRWVGAFQLVRGVNKIGIMASMLSRSGGRRLGVCADFSPANPIWSDIDLWRDFVSCTARFTLRGLPTPRVGIYYRPELVDESRAAEFDRIHERLCDRIHDAQVQLVFITPADLAAARPCEGGLQIGAAVLSVLILHIDGPLDTAEKKVLELVEKSNVRVVRIDSDAEVDLGLEGLSCLPLDRPAPGVRALSLSDGDWRGYLLFNETPTLVELSIRTKDAEFWREHPLDRTMPQWMRPTTAAGGRVRLDLLSGECRAFEITAHKSAAALPQALQESIDVTGPWTVAQDQSHLIGDDIEITNPQDQPAPAELGDYSIAHPDFSGSLLYQCRLQLPDLPPDGRFLLDLGTVCYSAEVWLNGHSLGRRAWSPFWFDATGHLRPGDNDLRIRTTNTLANQWLRPDIHARDKHTWPSPYLEISTPFMSESLHAGLIGPVVLRLYHRR